MPKINKTMYFKQKNISKIIIGILVLFLLMSLFIHYKTSKNLNLFSKQSKEEIALLESQLNEILNKYDSLKIVSKKFESTTEISNLNNALSNNNYSTLNNKNLNDQIKILKDSILINSKRIKVLEQRIKEHRKSITKLETIKKTDTKINTSGKLTATNVNAKGVKIYSDAYHSAAAKVEQLRVCYTLNEDHLVSFGKKIIYIQVVNPKNQIISKQNSTIEFEDNKLMYSASQEVNYTQKDTDACAYVDLEPKKVISGKYLINIYHDFVKIGSTTFNFK